VNDKAKLLAAIDDAVEAERKRLQIAVGTDQMNPRTARVRLEAFKQQAEADKKKIGQYAW